LVPVGLLAFVAFAPTALPQRASFFDYSLPILGGLGLLTVIGFVLYALRSNAVPSEKRALWVVVLLFVNFFALPFFWFWYVRAGRHKA
jgi:hypothetical protein